MFCVCFGGKLRPPFLLALVAVQTTAKRPALVLPLPGQTPTPASVPNQVAKSTVRYRYTKQETVQARLMHSKQLDFVSELYSKRIQRLEQRLQVPTRRTPPGLCHPSAAPA